MGFTNKKDNLYLLGVLLVGTCCTVFSFYYLDVPVAAWYQVEKPGGDLNKIVRFCELFGHGFGVVLASIFIFVLDGKNRFKIPRLMACSFLSGSAVVLIKFYIIRIRPRNFDFSSDAVSTFVEFMPGWKIESIYQSFPSGHTAMAVGLAMGLSWIYPKGRSVFMLLAIFVACQRILINAHYPSDTIVGAMVGFVVAQLCLNFGLLPRLFDYIERILERKHHKPQA